MKPLYLRLLGIVTAAIFLGWVLSELLLPVLLGLHLEGVSEDKVEKVARSIEQLYSENGDLDLGALAALEEQFGVEIGLFEPADLGLTKRDMVELKREGELSSFDEEGFHRLMLLGDEKTVAEIQDTEGVLVQEIYYQLLSLLITLTVVGLAIYYSLKVPAFQLGGIHGTVRQLNQRYRAERLNYRSAGIIGDIARELDNLSQGMESALQSRASMLESQRDLLHAVAHEFRSPMARLSFALEMLPDAQAKQDADSLYQDIQLAFDEMETLVKEVLQYSRLEHGDPVSEFEPVSVRELVTEVVSKQKIITPGVVFEVDGPDREIVVIEHLFERALINLVRNGAHFANSRVRISWLVAGDRLELLVEDDGIGVPPGKRERIFEPFTRLDPSRSRDSGGAGLGLAIVKTICGQHQGSVSVDDSPLGGALFCVSIPLSSTDCYSYSAQ